MDAHSAGSAEKKIINPVVDRIIDHLKLRFTAEKPPPSRVFRASAKFREGKEPEKSRFEAANFCQLSKKLASKFDSWLKK